MNYNNEDVYENKQRIIQELVPGKQITLAHIIANPDDILYKKLGLDPAVDYSENHCAIGLVTMSLIITGTVSEVQASLEAVTSYAQNSLGFKVCPITRT